MLLILIAKAMGIFIVVDEDYYRLSENGFGKARRSSPE
jgi:hypothetical protein